jgi:hypothetical protein
MEPEMMTVAGVITDGSGNPAARTVRIYRRSNGSILAETASDPVTGAYSVALSVSDEIQRIVMTDDIAEGVLYNDIIDRVIPG